MLLSHRLMQYALENTELPAGPLVEMARTAATLEQELRTAGMRGSERADMMELLTDVVVDALAVNKWSVSERNSIIGLHGIHWASLDRAVRWLKTKGVDPNER